MNDFDWGATELTLHSSLTKEDWDKLTDAELENTMSVKFQTPSGRQVKYIKSDVLDKIRAEIADARFIDKDTKHCKNANASGLEVAMDIIDKYMAEGSGEE